MALQNELIDLDNSVVLLASRTGIGASYLKNPESVIVEASSTSQYTKLQESFAGDSLFMAVMQEKWRFHTIARRTGEYVLPHFGGVSWVELIEPSNKSTRVSRTPMIKGISFYVDDLSGTHDVLKARNLEPIILEDGVSIPIRGTASKLIFTDVGISYSIEEYVKSGSAIQVQLDPR